VFFLLDRDHIQTLMYLKPLYRGHLAIFLTRTTGRSGRFVPRKDFYGSPVLAPRSCHGDRRLWVLHDTLAGVALFVLGLRTGFGFLCQ